MLNFQAVPGLRITLVAKTFPATAVASALNHTGKTSIRQRELPAHVVVYYVIALALYMQSSYREVLRCLLEGIKWLMGPEATVKVTGKSGISQARTRLGWEPMRQLHDEAVKPISVEATKGAHRLIALQPEFTDNNEQVQSGRLGSMNWHPTPVHLRLKERERSAG